MAGNQFDVIGSRTPIAESVISAGSILSGDSDETSQYLGDSALGRRGKRQHGGRSRLG
jgi:hypothetical protein